MSPCSPTVPTARGAPRGHRGPRPGYAVTTGEVIPAVTGVSAAVPSADGTAAASIGVSVFEYTDLGQLGTLVSRAARSLGELLD